ncbi:MAG: Holliday junction resolvase RuvX [Acidobacteria bacterium]|nr:Holliday junction resolvase RuvX [Acidobacteriota bacterium]
MRVIAFDLGAKRTGVAVSDATGTLARPLTVIHGEPLAAALALIDGLRGEGDGLSAVVVGLPRRLDGSANDVTPLAERFAEAVRTATGLPVALQDERLSSHEAEQRLAARERDWRRRKARIDAAAAAVILQDYLDLAAPGRTRVSAAGPGASP